MVLAASAGLAVLGPPGALIGVSCAWWWQRRHVRPVSPSVRTILLVLLVELRSGLSTLAALQATSQILPEHLELAWATRVATVDGLSAAQGGSTGEMRVLLSQLARAQRSGAPATRVVMSLLDAGLAEERARRMRTARSLPVKLMVPTSLMLLPGLMLMFYAPGLIRMLGDLSGQLS
jgi:hypothetical protein